jgi:hypothetical protein
MNGIVTLNGEAHISAGTLSGIGAFNCQLFIDGTSTLNPGGATPGSMNASVVNFASTATFAVDVSAAGDTLVPDDLNLNGANLAVNGTPTLPVYVIADYANLTGQFAGGLNPPALPPGYTIDYNYLGNNQIALVQSATPYQTWAAANITAIDPLADATPNGNPDNDGLSNLAEFGLNGNPLSGVNDGKVVSKIATVGGVPSLVLTLPVRTVATFSGATEQVSSLVSGLVYHIQGSAALSSWTVPVSEVTNPGEKAAIEAGLPAVDSGWSYRTFTTGPVSAASADFLRAVIEQP